MPISEQELIQYLLGEADRGLVARIRSALALPGSESASIAQRLLELRAALGLLDSLKSAVEPPVDLVSRTMNRIDVASLDSEAIQPQPDGPRTGSLAAARLATSGSRPPFRVWDSAILTVSIIALSCLLLPVVLEARSQSRKLQCAQHLRTLGGQLTQLAMVDEQHRFPTIATQGPRAFAGWFTVELVDAGMLENPELLKCVSLSPNTTQFARVVCIPSSSDFFRASPEQQRLWRVELGGNYAYNLGVHQSGRVAGPQLEGRAHFAILSDAPMIVQDREVFSAHDGRGINIFYEDGHVAFVRLSDRNSRGSVVDSWHSFVDHPFRNIVGEHAAGLAHNDAALGPSPSSPLPIPVLLPRPQ